MTEEKAECSAESRMLTELAARLGIELGDYSRLMQAITHKSFRFEVTSESQSLDQQVSEGVAQAIAKSQNGAQQSGCSGDNERLEFLGDAVLDLALSHILMTRFPLDTEGGLSKKRASLVNEEQLADLARRLQIDQVLRLGKGERLTGGVGKPRLLASALEAIIGAVYLEKGFDACLEFLSRIYTEKLARLEFEPDFALDFKTRLQEKMQERYRTTPTYTVASETGPDHDKQFSVVVVIDGRELGHGIGRNKKAAEQDAAKNALLDLAKIQETLRPINQAVEATEKVEDVTNG